VRSGLFAALALMGCADGPAPASAFEAPPLRSEALENGVRFDVVREGKGEPATAGDRVEIHYLLYLEDGTPIDDSHTGKPKSFLILQDDAFIEGLQHGMLGIRTGELRRVWVPPKLGYGDRRVGAIPPKSTLRFDVELMALHPNPYD
jgi:FKBP-type peptidyl-prolyl cis-trans isomerase